MFNYAMDKLDLGDRDIAVGGYSSWTELMMDNLEKERNVAYSRALLFVMDVWLAWLAFAPELKVIPITCAFPKRVVVINRLVTTIRLRLVVTTLSA